MAMKRMRSFNTGRRSFLCWLKCAYSGQSI